MSKKTIAVIGSGAAALSLAAAFPPSYEVTVITKKSVKNSNSVYAQGGIAAAYAKDDSIEAHLEDTLYAGCGHNNLAIAADVLHDGKMMVQSLLERGFPFDRNERGGVCLGREGATHTTAYFMQAETQQAGCLSIICSNGSTAKSS